MRQVRNKGGAGYFTSLHKLLILTTIFVGPAMKKTIAIFLSFFTLSAFTALVGNWEPISGTKTNFSIDGLFGIDVNGTIDDLKTEIHFFPDDLLNSSISATVSPATVDTKNKKRDKHLTTKDFFEVEKFPTISFSSRNFRKVGEYYIVEGDLTIKNITKQITIPFEFTDSGSTALFVGDFDIKRLDFDVGKKTIMMGNEVRVHLNIPVLRK
jgi:polyisoprenoid-binding protein YceI